MTKARMQALKKEIVNLTQSIKMNSNHYFIDTPQIPLTLIIGKPPHSFSFKYLAPYELDKKHLDKKPEEIIAAIPWEIVHQHNYCDEQRIENDFLELLLLCPSADEVSEFREDLKVIKTKSNLPHKLNQIQKEAIEEQIIKRNLKKMVLPDFKDVIKTWKDVKKIKTSLPELIKRVSKQPFAPQETDSCDIAYERLLMARKFESSQYFYLLMDNWKHHLRKTIFDGSCWPVAKQQHFFDVWEKALFKKTIAPLIPMKMRWKQAQSIDRLTGGKIVKYFSDLYVSNENSIDGQVVCILWTLIAISRQLKSNQASKLIDVINLSRTNVNIKNRSLRLNDKEIEISKGLTAIFAILIDIKYGKRELRLFPDMTVDRLEDALKRASKNIFVNETVLITPQAFLTFPHSFEGVRIAPKLLQGMCDESAYRFKPEDRIGMILRPFKLPIHH